VGDTAGTTSVAVVDVTALVPADLARAKEIAKGISVEDSQSIIQYGTGAQAKISGFADTMLSQIRTKDAGEVGAALNDLVFKIKEVDVGSLASDRRGFFGSLVNVAERFMARYSKLETQIDKIIDDLNDSKMTLLKDITMLDQLYQKNVDYLHELDLFLAAGQLKLDELRGTALSDLAAKAKASGDPMDAQRLNDFNAFLDRLEKKLYDLKLSRMVAIQTAPQVRLIQNNDQTLVEKIQSSIMTTIPLWKSQIVIAVSLFRQKKALGVQKAVSDATNDLLMKNSELLKTGSIEAARESERGIVEIETLKKTNDDLISTLEETLKIQAEGREKRAQAEKDLSQIESDLKAKLAAARGR
jgi:uncharacterized protein YaaN involved in tellurite resistance